MVMKMIHKHLADFIAEHYSADGHKESHYKDHKNLFFHRNGPVPEQNLFVGAYTTNPKLLSNIFQKESHYDFCETTLFLFCCLFLHFATASLHLVFDLTILMSVFIYRKNLHFIKQNHENYLYSYNSFIERQHWAGAAYFSRGYKGQYL